MGSQKKRAHKYFQPDVMKIKRAQRALRAKTKTEASERAFDFAIGEHQKNRLARKANERLLSSGIQIKDVYGVLAD
jgi:hypothetical protein